MASASAEQLIARPLNISAPVRSQFSGCIAINTGRRTRGGRVENCWIMATLSNLMVSSLRGVQKSLINPTTCNQGKHHDYSGYTVRIRCRLICSRKASVMCWFVHICFFLNAVTVRHASKKSSTCTRIKPGHPRPKHRGWKVQDGHQVPAGKILATQLKTRFHPGLNVSKLHESCFCNLLWKTFFFRFTIFSIKIILYWKFLHSSILINRIFVFDFFKFIYRPGNSFLHA